MSVKRKILIAAMAAAPLVGGGVLAGGIATLATTPRAGAQPFTSTTVANQDVPEGSVGAADPAGTSATTNVQLGTAGPDTTPEVPSGTEAGSSAEVDAPGGHQDVGAAATSTGGQQL